MPTQSRRDEKKARVLEAIAKGHSHTAAAAIAGIDRVTLYRWQQEATFATAVREAEDQGAAVHEAIVLNADDWRAHLAVLQVRRKEDWGKTEKVEQSGEVTVRVVRDG